jgi:5'-methylthioadenosine phosphorylase
MSKAQIGIIGGSGLYAMEGLEVVEELSVHTPYGEPSDRLTIARLEGRDVVFLPRHGRGHRLNPTQVPSRANIYAMKLLGVEQIISVSAVGSLKQEIRPRDLVIPDQLIDRTRSRVNTFFDEIAVHVGFADPFCPELAATLAQGARDLELPVHEGGTLVCMEGPLFSTRAESALHRSWGASIIGMTALPEAKLAREAEICYAVVCLATDYDVWHEEQVNVEMVLENLRCSLAAVQKLLRELIPRLQPNPECPCRNALRNAVVTDPALIPPQRRKDWAIFLDRYLST